MLWHLLRKIKPEILFYMYMYSNVIDVLQTSWWMQWITPCPSSKNDPLIAFCTRVS